MGPPTACMRQALLMWRLTPRSHLLAEPRAGLCAAGHPVGGCRQWTLSTAAIRTCPCTCKLAATSIGDNHHADLRDMRLMQASNAQCSVVYLKSAQLYAAPSSFK